MPYEIRVIIDCTKELCGLCPMRYMYNSIVYCRGFNDKNDYTKLWTCGDDVKRCGRCIANSREVNNPNSEYKPEPFWNIPLE